MRRRTNNQQTYDDGESGPRLSILPSSAVSDARLSNSEFRTLAALGVFADKGHVCWPSLPRLGAMLHKSPQAVSKDLHRLQELGLISIRPQFDSRKPGQRLANRYQLNFDTTPQLGIDRGYQLEVETPSTPEVETPSTPEVETPSTPEVETPSTPEVEVNVPVNNPKDDPKNDAARAPDDFSRLQDRLEKYGLILKPDDMQIIAGWVKSGIIPEDIDSAIEWRNGQRLNPVRGCAQLKNGVMTSQLKRLQTVPARGNGNGNGHHKFDEFTTRAIQDNASVYSAFSYLKNNPHGGGREESLERLAEFGIGFERYGEGPDQARLVQFGGVDCLART